MGTDRQPQEIEHCAAVLRKHGMRRKGQQDGKNSSFHLNNLKNSAKIENNYELRRPNYELYCNFAHGFRNINDFQLRLL
jgi:hypothetical protein